MLLNNLGILESHLVILAYLGLRSEFGVFAETVPITRLKRGADASVCRRYTRVTKQHCLPYIETLDVPCVFVTRTVDRWTYEQQSYVKWEWLKSCCDGYEPDKNVKDMAKCNPVCQSSCKNGRCVAPNTCNCNSNYNASISKTTGYSECSPYCPSGCPGGICVAPNLCTCDDGYLLTNDQRSCKPSCTLVGNGGSQGCGNNATCIRPHECRCNDGYTPVINTAVAKYSSLRASKPSTSNHLVTTSGPLHTTHNPVFTIGSIGCKPLCKPDCPEYSSCIAPNKCQCDLGYVSETLSNNRTNGSKCLPVCEKKCVNGFCSYPNRCTCLAGYKQHPNYSFICEPICDDECVNAICTLPNHCECEDGYEILSGSKPAGNVCVPMCPGGCLNGNCVASGVCTCKEGYVLTPKTSVNGTVTSTRNSNNGNISTIVSKESCQPFCDPNCPRGSLCIAPDQCQLQLLNISAHDFCNNNGVLSEDNGTCLCNHGWNGSKCNQATLCGLIFTLGNGSDEEFTTIKRIHYPNNWDWEGPMCKEECGKSVFSLAMLGNSSEDSIDCYHLELFETTAGLVSTEVSLSEIIDSGDPNKTLFCFFSAESSCNVIKSNINGIIVGSLVFPLIAGCGLCFYLYRRKSRNIAASGAAYTNDGTSERVQITETMGDTNEVEYF